MAVAIETDVSLREWFRREWASLRVDRQNVLLEGSGQTANAVLGLLQSDMTEPVIWDPTPGFDLPGHVDALILKNVDALSAANQRRLLAWMGRDGSRTQIISTSEHPLFTAVTRGLFEEALYYRLNVILLRP